MVVNDGDIYAIVSGVQSSGKSTVAIRMAKRVNYMLRQFFKKEVPKFNINQNVIFKPEKKDINELLSAKRYNTEVIDEGYLLALNLESSDKLVIYVVKVVSISRSKNNCIIMCFPNIKRATKGLMERFNIWIHKPSKKYSILFARSNKFITEDPWAITKILKSTSDNEIDYYLMKNPNKVCVFKSKALKPSDQDTYDELKAEGHLAFKKEQELREQYEKTDVFVLEDVYGRINAVTPMLNYDVDSISNYLKDAYQYNEAQIADFLRRYKRYDEMRKTKNVMEKRLKSAETGG